MDVCHVDEAGFAPTLPTCYSWSPVGQRERVPYEAPQGRRLNVVGALFSHGPQAGRLEYELCASLPTDRNKKALRCPDELARKHGLEPADIGTIDGHRLLGFLWRTAGRPQEVPDDWRRERPLVVVLDNYSVHTGNPIKQAGPALEAANVHLFFLPSYSPEMSHIEPVWQDLKHHRIVRRSHEALGSLKSALVEALRAKTENLIARYHTYRLSMGTA